MAVNGIEYAPWYQPDSLVMRCTSCGALIVSIDEDLHTEWHAKMARAAEGQFF